jgi:peroxiredoxin
VAIATTANHEMKPVLCNRRQALTWAGLAAATASLGGLAGCSSREPAPTSRFLLLDGSTLDSSALQGKVTLVNFWATTCTSCVAEMPDLIRTYQKFQPRGFETVAIAMSYDPVEWVLNFTKSRQLPFKVALDRNGELARSWGDVKLTPTTFLVDQQGRIVKRYIGPPDFAALHQLIDKLLAQA